MNAHLLEVIAQLLVDRIGKLLQFRLDIFEPLIVLTGILGEHVDLDEVLIPWKESESLE